MKSLTVDTRGRSCPEPVLMTKKALENKYDFYKILVDNKTALGNVTRFLKNAGLTPDIIEGDGEYTITVR